MKRVNVSKRNYRRFVRNRMLSVREDLLSSYILDGSHSKKPFRELRGLNCVLFGKKLNLKKYYRISLTFIKHFQKRGKKNFLKRFRILINIYRVSLLRVQIFRRVFGDDKISKKSFYRGA